MSIAKQSFRIGTELSEFANKNYIFKNRRFVQSRSDYENSRILCQIISEQIGEQIMTQMVAGKMDLYAIDQLKEVIDLPWNISELCKI